MHRLTAITIVGLIGTVVTGFVGMNLIVIAEQPLEAKLCCFGIVSAVVTTLTIAVVMGSRSLTALFDRISGETTIRTLLWDERWDHLGNRGDTTLQIRCLAGGEGGNRTQLFYVSQALSSAHKLLL